MIELYKKRGETPLQALDRLRVENPELHSETLSYAGRLDPMAEGILPVLVGEEENKNRKEYLNKDKKYYAEFALGVSTDTGDILGIIQNMNLKKIDERILKKTFENLLDIKSQTYPWYSSKTVEGKALFEYAREGKMNIERPQRDVSIYNVKDVLIGEENLQKVVEGYIRDIQNVIGDFRQEEIVRGWEGVCAGQALPAPHIQIVSCALSVSSGTYIRALCEILEKELGIPVVLQKLVRTKVF
jgi:tRNA pseudouridine(55) synthase